MFEDTTPDALAVQIRVLRSLGRTGRAAMTFELSDNMRAMVQAGVRHRHPEWDERAVKREVLRLMIGDDLYRDIFDKDELGVSDMLTRLLRDAESQAGGVE